MTSKATVTDLKYNERIIFQQMESENGFQEQHEVEMEVFSDMLQSFLLENRTADKESQIYRTDVVWFVEQLEDCFEALRNSAIAHHRKSKTFWENVRQTWHEKGESPSACHCFEEDLKSGSRPLNSKINVPQSCPSPSRREEVGERKKDGSLEDERGDTNLGNHERSSDSNGFSLGLPLERNASFHTQSYAKQREMRSRQIESSLLQPSFETLKKDHARTQSAVVDGSREKSREFMRHEIVALATALEESERHRADLLLKIQKERAINERLLGTLQHATNGTRAR